MNGYKPALLLALGAGVAFAACSDETGDDDTTTTTTTTSTSSSTTTGTGGGATGGGGGTGGTAGNGGTAGAAGSGEPCDYQNPEVVTVGTPVTRELPSANCAAELHFYRFTPATTGVYTITKSGSGDLGFCDTEYETGCMCGVNINCCTSCSLTFDLTNGDPLPAGSNNQLWVAPSGGTGSYTFTVSGPN